MSECFVEPDDVGTRPFDRGLPNWQRLPDEAGERLSAGVGRCVPGKCAISPPGGLPAGETTGGG